jgi:chemotaxis protein methyltransferase CheR
VGVTSDAALRELSSACGIDLALYRRAHVWARIDRALERENARHVAGLARLVRVDAEARARFRRTIALSVSGLFRDPQQFSLLEDRLLPPLIAAPGPIRVWSAGCANGAELYSLAIVLERMGALHRASLLGSDLLEENLAAARAGAYAPPVSPLLRARLRWEQRDLVCDQPPPGRWRLVVCRNVAIYLTTSAKHRLHENLVRALEPGGVLLLGRSERVSDPRPFGLERIGPHAYRRQR